MTDACSHLGGKNPAGPRHFPAAAIFQNAFLWAFSAHRQKSKGNEIHFLQQEGMKELES